MELFGLDLRGRLVLVTGGGPRAAELALRLAEAGAHLRVVAPHACEDMRELAAGNASVEIEARDAVEHDLDDAWLVVAADDGAAERARVRDWARARRIWCLDPADRGDAALAERTDVSGVRIGVLAPAGPEGAQRAAVVRSGIEDLLDDGLLDLRGEPAARGRVTLIGGGPGAPELITVQGRRALAEADVVVTDRLGPRSVLRHVRPGVEVIDVGKTPGHHPVPQHEINAILVEQASRGRAVVRLKGGDSFVFGRGGEEVQACRAAGVPVTVIPGVSSAIAVPELAGIPLTQRGVVAAFHVTSGHAGLDTAAQVCIRDASATVVVLMGVSNLGLIVEQALAAGGAPSTPVAIVERGSTPEQRVTRAPLSEIVATAALAKVRPPAVVVIGAVADPDLLEPQ